MTTKILSTFIFISLTSYGQQNNLDCSKVLNKTPYFITNKVIEPSDSLQLDFDILKNCGKLDSIDIGLLSGPMLGTIMIQDATNNTLTTYKSIIESINDFKKTEQYSKNREALIISKTLENKIVTADELEKDKELLIKVGLSDKEFEGFRKFVLTNSSQNLTYKDAFTKYSADKQSSQPSSTEIIEFNKFVEIESAINTGKENGKKVLLYFSCYGCINARKVEERVLNDKKVKSLLKENYMLFIAYSDDRSKDPATGSTVGEKIIKLQSDNFKTDYQPYFCVIDYNGKLLSEIGYTTKPSEFIDFLKKGMK